MTTIAAPIAIDVQECGEAEAIAVALGPDRFRQAVR